MPTLTFSIPNGDNLTDLPEARTFTVTAEKCGEADSVGAKYIWYNLIDMPALSLIEPVSSLIDEVDNAIEDHYEMDKRPTVDTIPSAERPLYDWLKSIESVSPDIQVQYEG